MNRFAIEEDDQFEVHVLDFKDKPGSYYGGGYYNAAKEVMIKAQVGSGSKLIIYKFNITK